MYQNTPIVWLSFSVETQICRKKKLIELRELARLAKIVLFKTSTSEMFSCLLKVDDENNEYKRRIGRCNW